MSREQGLAQAFVELADARNAGFDDVYFMNVLARHCVDLVGWSAIAVLLADQDGVLQVAATRPEGDSLAAVLEHPNEAGPGVDSYRSGTPVRLDLAVAGQPSLFAREAAAAGFQAVYAFPLQCRDDSIGSYALFTESPEPPEPEDLDLVRALAEAATITVLRRRELERAEVLAQQLQGALNSRVVIEQAKGILAERGGLDMEAAFDILRAHARKNRTRLALIARDLVEGRIRPELLFPARPGPARPGQAAVTTPSGEGRPTDPQRASASSRGKPT